MKLSYQQNANSNKTTRQPYASSTKLPINVKSLKGMLKGGTHHCTKVIMPGNQDDHDSIQDEENLNNYNSNGKLHTTTTAKSQSKLNQNYAIMRSHKLSQYYNTSLMSKSHNSDYKL